jgi:ribosomal protein S4E
LPRAGILHALGATSQERFQGRVYKRMKLPIGMRDVVSIDSDRHFIVVNLIPFQTKLKVP